MFVTSALAGGRLYRAIFLLQLLFYLVAIFGALRPSLTRFKPIAIANTFVMLNTAAALAFYNFVIGRNRVWVR
jgi:biofilm PGA synthesis N-glycosyltransferase PgaC